MTALRQFHIFSNPNGKTYASHQSHPRTGDDGTIGLTCAPRHKQFKQHHQENIIMEPSHENGTRPMKTKRAKTLYDKA